VPLALGLTGLIETHMLSCEMAAVVIILFCLLHIRDVTRPPVFFALLKSCGLTILLNLSYLVPFFDFMQDDYNIVSDRLTSLQDLALSLDDQLLYIVTGIILISGFLFAIRKLESRESYYLGTILLLGLVTLLMTGRNFPWDTIAANAGALSYYIMALQFPMRYLTMTTICFTVVLLGVVRGLSGYHIPARAAKAAVVLLCALPLLYTGIFYHDLFSSYVPLYLSGHNCMELFGATIVSGGEYLPAGMDTSITVHRTAQPDSNVTVDSCLYDNGRLYLTVENSSDVSGEVAVPLIYYRHYRAVDTATGEEYGISSSDDHLVSVRVPSGYDGTITIRFCEPWYYRVSELASLATLLAILFLYRRQSNARSDRQHTKGRFLCK
jgi:hypothetical protein